MVRDETRTLQVAQAIGMTLVKLKRINAYLHMQNVKNGADSSALTLLATLASCGPSRSNALAEAVHADPSTVSRQVAQLVKGGLVRREADNEDGRAVVLAITDAGRDELDRWTQRRNQLFVDVIADWPEHDLEQFAELFERFVNDYEQHLPIFTTQFTSDLRLQREEVGGR